MIEIENDYENIRLEELCPESICSDNVRQELTDFSMIQVNDNDLDIPRLDIIAPIRSEVRPESNRKVSNNFSSVKVAGKNGCKKSKSRIRIKANSGKKVIVNERERRRTKSLNKAFHSLRKIIPTFSSNKLSKIQTLKLASSYIHFLNNVLTANDVSLIATVNDRSPLAQRNVSAHGNNTNNAETLALHFKLWRMKDQYSMGTE